MTKTSRAAALSAFALLLAPLGARAVDSSTPLLSIPAGTRIQVSASLFDGTPAPLSELPQVLPFQYGRPVLVYGGYGDHVLYQGDNHCYVENDPAAVAGLSAEQRAAAEAQLAQGLVGVTATTDGTFFNERPRFSVSSPGSRLSPTYSVIMSSTRMNLVTEGGVFLVSIQCITRHGSLPTWGTLLDAFGDRISLINP